MARRDKATGLTDKGFALLEKMRRATPLQTLLMAIRQAQRDPAMRRALVTSLELETTQWREIYDALKICVALTGVPASPKIRGLDFSPAIAIERLQKHERIALAALRKIKRIREADDEAGEIARNALKRMAA